ncbi:MAG: hypothetical protein KJ914_17235 [Gammaproteobacteria bacterium]|nr:hypothetical protein [Gammaproteobacteria bacterium]MBU1723840.1 hypothetical protein [Gammaproteobacteria bacterium]MBU2004520.1 hypothetical protein [Gammaproteobacteria bacterium]
MNVKWRLSGEGIAEGWTFQWEPIAVFFVTFVTFIELDARQAGTTDISSPGKTQPHPADVKLFNDFLELLPSVLVTEHLHEFDFIQPFRAEYLQPIDDFKYKWANAEHRFIDPEVEEKRLDLYNAVKNFLSILAKNTSQNSKGFQAVRHDRHADDYDPEREARYGQEAAEINDSADLVFEKHQELVKTGRQKLLIEANQ